MAKHVVTGLAPDGRSTVLSQGPRAVGPASAVGLDDSAITSGEGNAEMRMARLYATASASDVDRSARPPVQPTPVPPGGTMWIELSFGGSIAYELHRTDTIDFHYILGGEVELILEDGSVHLAAGDSVVVPGVLHAWRSATGWSSNLVVVGLPPI
jgi:mannose-6-phosphate isomerase-like protein (cupin superfamily)